MISIIISGKDRVGKSVIGKHLKNANYCVIELGEIVRKEYINIGYKGSVSQFYNEYKDIYLDDILLETIKKKYKNIHMSKAGIIIIGTRSIDLFNKINSTINIDIVIYIESEFAIRYNRYLKMVNLRKNEPHLNKKLFQNQDLLQEKWGILKIKEKSNFIILNNSTTEKLISKINKIINK